MENMRRSLQLSRDPKAAETQWIARIEAIFATQLQLSREPSTGYYKLAMVERSLHETAASDRDLSVFQTLSKDAAPTSHYFEHLFDYLDSQEFEVANDALKEFGNADYKDYRGMATELPPVQAWVWRLPVISVLLRRAQASFKPSAKLLWCLIQVAPPLPLIL